MEHGRIWDLYVTHQAWPVVFKPGVAPLRTGQFVVSGERRSVAQLRADK